MRCAKCCFITGVGITPEDLNREPRLWQFAAPLSRVDNLKMREYMIEKGIPFALGKRKHGDPCPFLLKNKCMIYETRPDMCRNYQCRQ
jgi:Fe-S-cluster containining protein